MLYGVGYNSGKNGYKTKKNGKTTLAYRSWDSMLKRCNRFNP